MEGPHRKSELDSVGCQEFWDPATRDAGVSDILHAIPSRILKKSLLGGSGSELAAS